MLVSRLDEEQRWVAMYRAFHGVVHAVENIAPASLVSVPENGNKKATGRARRMMGAVAQGGQKTTQ